MGECNNHVNYCRHLNADVPFGFGRRVSPSYSANAWPAATASASLIRVESGKEREST